MHNAKLCMRCDVWGNLLRKNPESDDTEFGQGDVTQRVACLRFPLTLFEKGGATTPSPPGQNVATHRAAETPRHSPRGGTHSATGFAPWGGKRKHVKGFARPRCLFSPRSVRRCVHNTPVTPRPTFLYHAHPHAHTQRPHHTGNKLSVRVFWC